MKKQSDTEYIARIIGASMCDYLARHTLTSDDPPERFDWFMASGILAALRRRGWKQPTKKGKKVKK